MNNNGHTIHNYYYQVYSAVFSCSYHIVDHVTTIHPPTLKATQREGEVQRFKLPVSWDSDRDTKIVVILIKMRLG